MSKMRLLNNGGWIKLNRSIYENWVFDGEPMNQFGAWIDLLLMANYKDGEVYINNVLCKVKRGQTLTSISKLALRWKRGRKWSSTLLHNLEKSSMILQNRDNRFTLITICKYESFQAQNNLEGQGGEQPPRRCRAGEDTTLAHNIRKKEVKKEIKKSVSPFSELDFSGWPVVPTSSQARMWYDTRNRKKIPISQGIVDSHGKKFVKLQSLGLNLQVCLQEFLENGWMAPEPRYFENRKDLKTGSAAVSSHSSHKEWKAPEWMKEERSGSGAPQDLKDMLSKMKSRS